jgi:uncharacterized protein (TIGR02246 family)
MKRSVVIVVISSLLSLPLTAQSTRGQVIRQHPVESFFLSGIEAFNAHDLDRFMKQFADDIQMYTPTGWLRSQAEVRERFQSTFKQFPNVKMEITELRVREVSPGTVVTDFRWKVYPMGSGPAFHGVGSGVYIKRRGQWTEVLEHETVTQVDDGLKPDKK